MANRDWLKELRRRLGMTQKAVADRFGMSQSYYCLIESGKRGSKLCLKTARKLAEIFNISIEEIFELEEETEKANCDAKE